MTADRQVRSTRILALLFCAAGAVAILLGWNATASRASATAQLPYLLSGGAAGIGLLTFGVGLLLIAQLRAERRRVTDVLELMGSPLVQRARAPMRPVPVRAASDGGVAIPAANVTDGDGDGHGHGEERTGLPMRSAKIVALVLAVAGFAMIVLGWSGMTNAITADAQLPYMLSGGFGGVALILGSVGLLLVAQIRAERRKLTDVLAVVAVAVAVAVAQTTSARTPGPARGVQVPAAGATDGGRAVVAGASTYHRPDCRLAQGASGLRRTSVEAAKASGLAACPMCDPAGAGGTASTDAPGAPAESAAV